MIVRVKHTKENPYIILNRDALWDKNLSLEAVGLWARLLSRPDDWTFYVSELCKTCRCGETKMLRMLKELIKHGYVYRVQNKAPDGKFTGYEYYVFEKSSTHEEIKIIFPHLDFPDTGLPGLANQGLLSTKEQPSNKERINTDVQTEVRTSQVKSSSIENNKKFSGIAYQRAVYFHEKLLKLHPKLKMPNLNEWAIELDRMQRIDKRTADDIVGMIDWALEDSFWCSNILSPAALRRNFDKMNAKRFKPEVKGDYIAKNRALSYELVSDFKNKDKGKVMRVTDKELLRTDTHESIPFTEHPEKFTSEVCRIFSLKWSA